MSRGLIAGFTAAAVSAGAAHASVSITFDDPGSGPEFTHTAPTSGGGTGDLDFRADLPVDLQLVGTGAAAGLGTVNFSAFLETDFAVGAITSPIGSPFASASLTGSFRWVEEGTGTVILEGAFVDAAVITFGISGSIITNSDITGGSLAYTPGAGLIGLGITTLIDPQDAVWTLTDVNFANGQSIIDVDNERFFNDFDANAAFTGTAEVPAPGAAALAMLAGAAAIRRRR